METLANNTIFDTNLLNSIGFIPREMINDYPKQRRMAV
jgi:hypothetical protein